MLYPEHRIVSVDQRYKDGASFKLTSSGKYRYDVK